MEEGCCFSKKDTNIVKGIAILAMILHHVYPNSTGTPIYMLDNKNIIGIVASCGKICVSLLTILSGFGLTESFKKVKTRGKFKNTKFVLSHLIQLFSVYWSIFGVALLVMLAEGNSISSLYGSGIEGIVFFIADFLGVAALFKSTALIGAWYLTTIIFFYIIFPLLYYVVNKIGVFILLLAYVPWIYYIIESNANLHTDWWLFYIFSFLLGIYLSNENILNRLYKISYEKGLIISIVVFLVSVILRLYITLPIDPFLSVSIIVLEIFVFSKIRLVAAFLKECGIQSANIWLIHPVIIYTVNTVYFRTSFSKFIFVMFISMAVSLLIEKIKNDISINEWTKQLRKKII